MKHTKRGKDKEREKGRGQKGFYGSKIISMRSPTELEREFLQRLLLAIARSVSESEGRGRKACGICNMVSKGRRAESHAAAHACRKYPKSNDLLLASICNQSVQTNHELQFDVFNSMMAVKPNVK